MKIIGIGGTNGAGKDTLSQILEDDGWLFVSASRDLFIPELKRRGLPLEREQMAALSAEWRRQVGKGVTVEKAFELYKKKSRSKKYNGLVISSIRHPWEADSLHRLGGKVVWIDADPQVRYDRIFSRGQGDKDKKTFEQFLSEEEAEMNHHSGDDATLSMAEVKANADIFLTNDTNDVGEFKKSVRQALDL